jgi:hypothetical protein
MELHETNLCIMSYRKPEAKGTAGQFTKTEGIGQ